MNAPRSEYAAEAEAILGGQPASIDLPVMIGETQPDPRIAIATALAVEWVRQLNGRGLGNSDEFIALRASELAVIGAAEIVDRLENAPA